MELNEFSTLENVLRDLYWVKNLVISHWSKCRPIKGNPSQSWILGFHAADFGFHCSLDFWWVARRSPKLVPSSALPALWRVLYSKFYDLWLAVVDLVPSSLIDQSEGKIWSKWENSIFLFKYLDCVAFGKARRGRLFRTGLTWPNWPLRSCLIL